MSGKQTAEELMADKKWGLKAAAFELDMDPFVVSITMNAPTQWMWLLQLKSTHYTSQYGASMPMQTASGSMKSEALAKEAALEMLATALYIWGMNQRTE